MIHTIFAPCQELTEGCTFICVQGELWMECSLMLATKVFYFILAKAWRMRQTGLSFAIFKLSFCEESNTAMVNSFGKLNTIHCQLLYLDKN